MGYTLYSSLYTSLHHIHDIGKSEWVYNFRCSSCLLSRAGVRDDDGGRSVKSPSSSSSHVVHWRPQRLTIMWLQDILGKSSSIQVTNQMSWKYRYKHHRNVCSKFQCCLHPSELCDVVCFSFFGSLLGLMWRREAALSVERAVFGGWWSLATEDMRMTGLAATHGHSSW